MANCCTSVTDFGLATVIKMLSTNNQQGPTVQHRELCPILCGSLDGRGVWEGMNRCICMAESLCCSPETITALFTGYTPMQNEKFKEKDKSLVI